MAAVGLIFVVASCGGSDDGGSAAATTTTTENRADADVAAGGDQELPDFFPADFYLPDGIRIRGVTQDPTSGAISLTGTFESGDAAAIQQDVVAGLQAAGYELLANDDIAAFVRNGVGRVRVHTSEFLGELTLSVDIDAWTDEQLDELRALFTEDVVVDGSATAEVGGESLEAEGECTLRGENRSFYATDVSITLEIDETQDPPYVYADVTFPDGRIFILDTTADAAYESTPQTLSAGGQMVEFGNDDAGPVPFTVTASCAAQ